MNNEPVAWIIQDKYGRPALSWKGEPISYNAISVEQGDIPLYTHPAKTLTDEEIWEVIDNCFCVHAFNLDYQIALDEAREDAFELVKAILRKAQEK